MSRRPSVHDIIRKHPRENLWVQPLEWTSLHLELLNCTFEDAADPEDAVERDLGEGKYVDRWARTAERLATSEMKTVAAKKLLAEADGPLKFLRPFGYFCFGSEHEFRLHGAIFAQRSGKQTPMFAFMQRGMIRIQREGVFPLPRPRRVNPPAELLQRLRLRRLEPSDPWRDPYILAVLVGMAQSQAQSLYSEKGSFDQSHLFKACAALVDENNTDFMFFYTANISAAFLSKFEYPNKLRPSKETLSSELRIGCKKIPFQPFASLRGRLNRAIVSFCGKIEDSPAQ
ncbi:hypothetical protein FALBO_13872 [Fusarium albosuccineum]|uniref:Uncharacterized protein n=1 Tax=Fusarium albosuccineum TaxID=1237068 RepID=A0A8H4L1F8_9HYPO|nr:hypothetical protein FALBO_13872 [Fusarium albosuccineum]